MLTLQSENDIRVMNVYIDDDRLTVDLMDGRSISVPVAGSRVLLLVQLSSDKTGSCVVLVMVSTGLNWMRT